MNEFIYPLRIHIEDTDFLGTVYHSQYLNFMERARSEWAEQVGIGLAWQREHKVYLVVHSIAITYLKPVGVHEKVEIVSRVLAVKPASIIFEQYLRSAENKDNIITKAEVKVACTDQRMKPRPFPDASFLETIRRVLT